MKIAIMQPYLFPYIGYFQLINAVDDFVFYDDVNFMKKGWVHRNAILVNGNSHLFTIPCMKASQNKLIKDIKISNDLKALKKILKTIEIQYIKAPYFEKVYQVIERILSSINMNTTISELSIKSVLDVCEYLNVKCNFSISSKAHFGSVELKRDKRLIHICKEKNAKKYLNPKGGMSLYNKENFEEHNIQLKFINSLAMEYKQFENPFVPKLSIIDVMMFNSKKESKELLNQYELL